MNPDVEEQKELHETIKVLQKCKSAKDPELRGNILGLINKLQNDYTKLKARQSKDNSSDNF